LSETLPRISIKSSNFSTFPISAIIPPNLRLSQTSYAEDSRYRYLEGFWVRGVSCEIIELQGYNRGSE
jgi:hypothetical protein